MKDNLKIGILALLIFYFCVSVSAQTANTNSTNKEAPSVEGRVQAPPVAPINKKQDPLSLPAEPQDNSRVAPINNSNTENPAPKTSQASAPVTTPTSPTVIATPTTPTVANPSAPSATKAIPTPQGPAKVATPSAPAVPNPQNPSVPAVTSTAIAPTVAGPKAPATVTAPQVPAPKTVTAPTKLTTPNTNKTNSTATKKNTSNQSTQSQATQGTQAQTKQSTQAVTVTPTNKQGTNSTLSPQAQEAITPQDQNSEAIVTRRIEIELGSYIDVPIEGSGWVYLSEKDGKTGIAYASRRYDETGNSVFTLRTEKLGDYILRFQHQDLVHGTSRDEYIAVTVVPKKVTNDTAAATVNNAGTEQARIVVQPQNTVPNTDAATSYTGPNANNVPSGTAAPTVVAPSADSPEGMLLAIKNALAANPAQIQSAIELLDAYLQKYPLGSDEIFYLYGFALEQRGPYQDIARAYSYYKKVQDEYPRSKLWQNANDRTNYLDRRYFNIR